MKRRLVEQLLRLCAYLVKGFCAVVLSVLVFTLLSWAFGATSLGISILSALFPLLLRAAIVIGCTLAITSLSAGI
jgi:hypothetical protein